MAYTLAERRQGNGVGLRLRPEALHALSTFDLASLKPRVLETNKLTRTVVRRYGYARSPERSAGLLAPLFRGVKRPGPELAKFNTAFTIMLRTLSGYITKNGNQRNT